MSSMPAIGQTAPDFQTQDERGNTVSLSALRGHQAVALCFYPKDDTPG